MITLLQDNRGRLTAMPVVTLIGLDEQDEDGLAERIEIMLDRDLKSKGDAMEAEAVLLLRRYCNQQIGKKPVTRVQIIGE